MTTVPINDPIEVIVHFSEKSIYPLRFKWKNRAYKIKKIHFKWEERVGEHKLYHFRVQSETSDIFELIFDTEKLRWKLATVELEG